MNIEFPRMNMKLITEDYLIYLAFKYQRRQIDKQYFHNLTAAEWDMYWKEAIDNIRKEVKGYVGEIR